MLTDRNYELALSQLTARYSNRRIIAESHLDELSNAPKATFSDGTSIRNSLNVVTESTGALENLTYPVDQWDPVLLHLLQKKLDQPLRAQWELLVDTTEDPTVKEFITFLTKYCKSATVSQNSKEVVKPYMKGYKSSKSTVMFSSQQAQKTVTNKFQRYDHSEKKSFSFQVCNEQPGHLLIHCAQFKEKNPQERHQIIKDLNRCFMCFSEHLANQCKNTKKCYECGGRHHTMLHLRTTESSSTMPEQSVSAHVTMAATQTRRLHSSILLSTASVRIQNENGHSVTVRALLDSASQSSFITEGCVKRLGLNRMKSEVMIQALAGTQVPAVRGKTNVVVCPVGCDEPRFMLDVLILTRITGSLPSNRIQVESWPHLEGLSLADPQYNEPLPIDLLIGADMFPCVVSGEKKQGDVNQPIAFSTVFGWVLMGRISSPVASIPVTMCSTLESIDRTFKQFLEVENVPTVVKNTPEDIECEEIYKETTNRQPDGRYIVNLPFKQKLPLLGYSKDQALCRLRQLENRFQKSPELRKEYNKGMRDYLDTGHMSEVEHEQKSERNSYYIPHQAVERPGSTTTKMRIVFDASMKTTSGMSLKDHLHCGQKLHQDLPGIVLRFRLHLIVFTTDIKQTFRQINVTETHRPYQRLLYRFSSNEDIQVYEMNTVTFGLRSSPFLAIRTLHQLVQDEAANDPKIQTIVKRDMYVDDIATGAENEEEAIKMQQSLVSVFAKGHFELRKWSSNSKKLLENIPEDHRQTHPVSFKEYDSDYTKVLGLNWQPRVDSFSYSYQPNPVRFSKRAILSEIARIYDPLGLLAPVTTDLKRLMKYLWLAEVGWDQEIPEEAIVAWRKYHEQLPLLATLRIPRQVTQQNSVYELHGFSDSSEAAYAAVVYLRVDSGNEVTCKLLMGKSKIVPASKMSIPRSELCGALLLARLLEFIKPNLVNLDIGQVIAWSDSTVTLAWIKTPTAKLKTFVANRVAKIQQVTCIDTWRHVPTAENPADCASRGLGPKDLATHELWWNGPEFLRHGPSDWPQKIQMSPTDSLEEEIEEKPVTLTAVVKEEEVALLHHSDNLPKILRLTVYLLRFRNLLRDKTFALTTALPTSEETDFALQALVRWTQHVFFRR